MCNFCDELKKQMLEEEAQKAYLGLKDNRGRHIDYTVFLAVNLREGKRILQRWSLGEYELRFCPQCGASITRRIRQWKSNPDGSAKGMTGRERKRRRGTANCEQGGKRA